MSDRSTEFSTLGWQVLWVVGITLVTAGVVDLGLGLYPFRFGVPEWEFGSIANLLNRLPLLGIGLTLVLVASLARGRARGSFLWSAVLLMIAVVVFVFGVLYATNLPLVLASMAGGAARKVLEKSILKTVAQIAIYFLGFFAVAVYGVRSAGRLRPR
jgi:hypothetical protein